MLVVQACFFHKRDTAGLSERLRLLRRAHDCVRRGFDALALLVQNSGSGDALRSGGAQGFHDAVQTVMDDAELVAWPDQQVQDPTRRWR